MKTISLRTIGDDTPEARKLLAGWDVSEELRQWSSQLRKKDIPWTTTVNWGAPRADGVFHPSSFDKNCDFFLWLEYVGANREEKMPPNTQLIMDSGTLLEQQYQYYQHTMALDGGYFYESSYPVWKHGLLSKELGLGGEADGLLERTIKLHKVQIDLRAIVEYKTIGKDGFSGLRTKPAIKYVRQTQGYLASMDVPVAIIVYINRDNAEPRHFFSWYDPKIWTPIEQRLRRLKTMADNFEEPEKKIGDSCKWCKFLNECNPFPKKRSGRTPRV